MSSRDRSGVFAAVGGRTLGELIRANDEISPEDAKRICKALGIDALFIGEELQVPPDEARERLLEAVRMRQD